MLQAATENQRTYAPADQRTRGVLLAAFFFLK